MLKSHAQDFLDNWFTDTSKVFKYYQQLLPVEYIVIEKRSEEEYIAHNDKSTCEFKDLTKDEIINLLHQEVIEYDRGYYLGIDLIDLKTGGCDCAAWATTNPNNHVYWCKKIKFGY